MSASHRIMIVNLPVNKNHCSKETPQMNCKQNERINQVKESTLVVGIDIGSTTHYARAFDWRGIELGKVFKFSNSREGFDSFKNWMITAKVKMIVKIDPKVIAKLVIEGRYSAPYTPDGVYADLRVLTTNRKQIV